MAHKLAPQAYAAKMFSMNEEECNVLLEKQNQNVINENIETEGGLVHQKFCCVRSYLGHYRGQI